jgi:hypothetical protein
VYQRLKIANDPWIGDWLAELANTPFRPDSEIGEHAATIASNDAAAAVAWVASLPPSPRDGHYSGIGRTVKALARNDPVAVENWLVKLPGSPLRDQALAAYANFLDGESKPEDAQRWRAQVEDQRNLRGQTEVGLNVIFQTIGGKVQPVEGQ